MSYTVLFEPASRVALRQTRIERDKPIDRNALRQRLLRMILQNESQRQQERR